MPLTLTHAIVEAAYEYLRATPPFRGWRLPHADEVEFGITRHRDRYADHTTYYRTANHVIRVSAPNVKTTDMLMQTLAHEMIHERMELTKTASRKVDHNAEFKRLAGVVCRAHGWDVRLFV